MPMGEYSLIALGLDSRVETLKIDVGDDSSFSLAGRRRFPPKVAVRRYLAE